MKPFSIVTIVTLATIGLGLGATAAAAADAQPSIQIVTALYGKENGERSLNFTTRLQQTCGDQAATCEAFCSDAFVGRLAIGPQWPFSAHPICRVVYRCGGESTRTAEANRNETVDLDCRRQD